MVRENPTWGQARVAAELAIKLGILVSPRTVRAYWPDELRPNRSSSQRWMTFVRNHARAIVACDFVVAVTLHFRILYVFVVMEVGTRKLLHVNATLHPLRYGPCSSSVRLFPVITRTAGWSTIVLAFSRKTWIAPSKPWESKF